MDFVQEGKLDEEKKRRQAEWERVRGKDDPIEAPPEVFDNRTLYDKLKEQHDIKKKEFEESFALKNQVRGVDSDEVDFLNEIDRVRIEREREIRLQEKKELEEVKKAAARTSTTATALPKITVNLPTNKKENKQAELLSHAIKRKSTGSGVSSNSATSTLMKLTHEEFDKITEKNTKKHKRDREDAESDDDNSNSNIKDKKSNEIRSDKLIAPSYGIIGGILPGLGDYNSDSSSASQNSTDDENDDDVDTNAILNKKSSDISAASKLSKM